MMTPTAPAPDYSCENFGTLWLVHTHTTKARVHLHNRTPESTWYCDALVVESRFMPELVRALQAEGFRVTTYA